MTEAQRAERELALCDGCKGKCGKEFNRFFRPIIDTTIRMTPCQFAKVGSKVPRYSGKTFDDYEVTDDNRRAVKIARWYAKDKPGNTLYLYGGCGTGKTFLASLIAQGFDEDEVVFDDVPCLLDRIKSTFDGVGSGQAIIAEYCSCELLILDDIGTGKITDWNVGILYQIINARYNASKPLIVTSNYDLDGLAERLARVDDIAARRIVSRLSEGIKAFLGVKDRRRLK